MIEGVTRLSAYAGAEIALLTQHGKEQVIAPLFHQGLAAPVRVVTGFDTDVFGTFTRDVSRFGSQMEAARQKARVALALSGLSVGLGSEGSFGPGPGGFGPWNLELLILIDAARGIEILGRGYAPGRHCHALVTNQHALEALALRAGFPEHGLVVRPDGPSGQPVLKGIRALPELHRAWSEGLSASSTGGVFVENDLRAHMNPTRMSNIEAAARDLIVRAATLCQACSAPGFGLISKAPGLPCRDCGAATEVTRAEIHGCVGCNHREVREVDHTEGADPGACGSCNP